MVPTATNASEPAAPVAPRGMAMSKTAAADVPLFVTVTEEPAAPVVTVPTAIVAAAPAAPAAPVAPVSPVSPCGP